MLFTIVCAVILIIVAGIFMSKTKKEEVKPEVVIPKEYRPINTYTNIFLHLLHIANAG